jgi:hypothetical protein
MRPLVFCGTEDAWPIWAIFPPRRWEATDLTPKARLGSIVNICPCRPIHRRQPKSGTLNQDQVRRRPRKDPLPLPYPLKQGIGSTRVSPSPLKQGIGSTRLPPPLKQGISSTRVPPPPSPHISSFIRHLVPVDLCRTHDICGSSGRGRLTCPCSATVSGAAPTCRR